MQVASKGMQGATERIQVANKVMGAKTEWMHRIIKRIEGATQGT
jgi:hypothetical protein